MGMLLVLSCAFSAGLGTCLHGYNAGVISHIIANEHFNNYFKTQKGAPILGAIVSVFAGGAALGSLASGLLLDDYGRRRTIQVGAVISILGVMLQAASSNLTMMIVGRIVSGFAIGMMSVGVPIYLAECAYPKSRGFITGWVQFMILLGFVASSWVGYAAHNVPNAATNAFTWRFPIAIAAIPAVFITFALQWLPESPRYLIRQGMTEQAYRSMMKLYHDGSNREIIQKHIHEVYLQWKKESQVMPAASDWAVMWKVPKWRARVINAAIPSLFTQFTGINIITYYQNSMYKGLGFDESKSLMLNAVYHMVAPICTFIFITFIIDSKGRKKPLLFMTPVLSLLFIAYASIISTNQENRNKSASSASLAFIYLYNIVFSVSWGPTGWTYISEIIPLRIRGKGTAVAVAVGNWAANVLVSQISPLALDAISWRYYIVYSVFNLVVTLPCVYFFMKEPRKMTLEAIDELWEPKHGPEAPPDAVELGKAMKLRFVSRNSGSSEEK